MMKNEERKFLFTSAEERKLIIMNKVKKVLDEIESEGEVCGYIFFGFMPKDENIESWAEYEGIVNPAHILEALENYKIVTEIKLS